MGHDAGAFRVMLRSFAAVSIVIVACASLQGCERKQRARERDALEAEARAKLEARRRAAQANVPLPEEPPVELLRVADSGLPCAVDDVFARKCRRCHTIPTRHGAPFVFLTWQDTQQTRADQPLTALIGRAVRSGFMPYRIEANPKVEPLTDDEKKIILDWIDAGAPRVVCGAAENAAPPKAKTKAAPSASSKPRADAPPAVR
jgi:hypothetical protein